MHQENVWLQTADRSSNYVINLVSHSCIFSCLPNSAFWSPKWSVCLGVTAWAWVVTCGGIYEFRIISDYYIMSHSWAAMLSSKRCKLRFIKKVATRNISDFLLETAAAAEWSADNPLGNRRHRTVGGTLNPAPARKHGDYFQDHCPHFGHCSKNAQGKNIFDIILYLPN